MRDGVSLRRGKVIHLAPWRRCVLKPDCCQTSFPSTCNRKFRATLKISLVNPVMIACAWSSTPIPLFKIDIHFVGNLVTRTAGQAARREEGDAHATRYRYTKRSEMIGPIS